MTRRRRAWTPAEDVRLLGEIAAGAKRVAVAEQLGRCYASICSRIDWLGQHRPLDLERALQGIAPPLPGRRQMVKSGGRGDARQRRCLRCSHQFASAHAGNRICPRCTQINAGASPYAASA